ncbi:hypothetical protein HPP92_028238, partial [Vanilla planifolia]
ATEQQVEGFFEPDRSCQKIHKMFGNMVSHVELSPSKSVVEENHDDSSTKYFGSSSGGSY